MRVLVTGARGQAGHELLHLAPAGFDVVGLDSAALDITDALKVGKVIHALRPELIINAAAYTTVDKAEQESARAWAVNRDGVANLAHEAERLSIPVFHISTDYVFAGDAHEPYQETAPTAPLGVYGASKLGGELALADNCSRHIILRTSWVFGAYGNNFVKTMLRLGRERKELKVVADQYGCPTSSASIAQALWSLATRYREHGQLQWGIYNFSGTPACNWHEFAQEIFRQAHELGLLSRVPVVHAITTEDYSTPAKRPAWSVLGCAKLSKALDQAQPNWTIELTQVLSGQAELKTETF